jgi:polyhydroxyalkanoate synthesis regulator phasin
MNAPIIGTVEVPRLTELTKDVARRGRAVLDASRSAYLAGLGVVATAQNESAKAVDALVGRVQETYDTLVVRGEPLDRARAEKVAALRADVAAGRDAAARRLDAAIARPVRDATTAAARGVGIPSRDEVRALAANVAELSRKVDALVARLGAMPAAAAEPTVTVTATDEGWAVQVEGTANVLSAHATKDEAVEAARALAAERAPSHLIVYKKDGTIGDRSSYHV